MNYLVYMLLLLVIALLLYAMVLGQTKTARPVKSLSREETQLKWATIEAMVKQGGLGLRSSVLEADKLLDHTMRSQGFRGQTMAERLRTAQPKLSDHNAVWRAHKLRNMLAHEVGADVVPSQVKQAVADYKKALIDLGAL